MREASGRFLSDFYPTELTISTKTTIILVVGSCVGSTLDWIIVECIHLPPAAEKIQTAAPGNFAATKC